MMTYRQVQAQTGTGTVHYVGLYTNAEGRITGWTRCDGRRPVRHYREVPATVTCGRCLRAVKA
jgi:hypothetical protein